MIAERYARGLEATVRAHPADWLWIHNKWKYGEIARREARACRQDEGAWRPRKTPA